jgi:hypothetical protein
MTETNVGNLGNPKKRKYSCFVIMPFGGGEEGSVALSVFHPNRSLISLKKNCQDLLNATEPTLSACTYR